MTQISEPAPGEGDGAAPEAPLQLETHEILRSKEMLVGGKAISMAALGGYTIISQKNAVHIAVLHPDGRLESTLPNLNTNYQVDWGKVASILKKKYLCPTSRMCDASDIHARDLPQPWISWLPVDDLTLPNYKEIKHIASNITSVKNPEIILLCNGKYILVKAMGADEKYFPYFVTQTPDGRLMEPRNWQIFDTIPQLPAEIPGDLMAALSESRREVLRGETGYSLSRGSIDAQIDSGSIHLRRQGVEGTFTDQLFTVRNNVCFDPHNPSVVYYCTAAHPGEIWEVDCSNDDARTWHPERVGRFPAPSPYDEINDLEIDPTGEFFVFKGIRGGGVPQVTIVNRRTLQEVIGVPAASCGNVDADGRFRYVDSQGRVIVCETNLAEIATQVASRHALAVVEDFDPFGAQTAGAGSGAESGLAQTAAAAEITGRFQAQFEEKLGQVKIFEGTQLIRQALEALRIRLQSSGLQRAAVEAATAQIEAAIAAKERELAEPVVREGIDRVRAMLKATLSLSTATLARETLEDIEPLKNIVGSDLAREISTIGDALRTQSTELFRVRGAEMMQDIDSVLERTRETLAGLERKSDFDEWQENDLPQLKARLGRLEHECPAEQHDVYTKIRAARTELNRLSDEYEKTFRERYGQIREAVAVRTAEAAAEVGHDIDRFMERLHGKSFGNRAQAELYVTNSESKKQIEEAMAALELRAPESAHELAKKMRVSLATAYGEIDRGTQARVADTGEQMVAFGTLLFPKWEAKTKQRGVKQVGMTFMPNKDSLGPGIKPKDALGDVVLNIQGSDGHTKMVTLYEGFPREHELRLGTAHYKDSEIPASYMTAQEFVLFRKAYGEWVSGKLRKEYGEKRQALWQCLAERPRSQTEKLRGKIALPEALGKPLKEGPEFEAWKTRFEPLYKAYGEFCAEKHITLLRRIDHVAAAPEEQHANGKGFVPQWENHWVVDEHTEKYLEEVADAAKLQLKTKAGILVLKGHAGTGKDVLVSMFCNRTNRPVFTVDCSKWTTESDLAVDLQLEAPHGAVQTLKVPSAVVNAIMTPGAVLYFNELNAMPEQAQIFLHSLWDEKRRMTIKEEGGRVVRADPTVLFMGSMNPDYPGTFKPQFATRSRMVEMDVHYPPLYKDPEHPNTSPYSAAEALRLARELRSFADLTYEQDLKRNEFVLLWERHINGVQNGAPELTPVQRFDLNVILALVQFTDKLRAPFMLHYDDPAEARKKYKELHDKVTQPLTSRELRLCAVKLDEMEPALKAAANAEQVARDLLKRFFLRHLDKRTDQEKIENIMKNWTTQNRAVA